MGEKNEMDSPLKSYDPSNGEMLGEVPVASADQITADVEKARKGHAQWSD